jgi:hypothetical protein
MFGQYISDAVQSVLDYARAYTILVTSGADSVEFDEAGNFAPIYEMPAMQITHGRKTVLAEEIEGEPLYITGRSHNGHSKEVSFESWLKQFSLFRS